MNLLVCVHYSDNGCKRQCSATRLQDRGPACRQRAACLHNVGKAQRKCKAAPQANVSASTAGLFKLEHVMHFVWRLVRDIILNLKQCARPCNTCGYTLLQKGGCGEN